MLSVTRHIRLIRGRQEQVFKTEKIRALRRLAVAGLGMVQVMMFAVALYAGEGDGMSNDVRAVPALDQFITHHTGRIICRKTIFHQCMA